MTASGETIETAIRADIAQAILDYGEAHHPAHHPGYGCPRCDILAAYRHAAQIARGKP